MQKPVRLEIEYVNIDTIKPYSRNAKSHPKEQIEQIKESMLKFDNIDPIGIWHGEIVEGHGRYLAAKELGIKEVPVIRLDHLTNEKRRAYALIHNKLTMNSDFDYALLELELADLEDLDDLDMADFGFDMLDLGMEEKEADEDEYEVNLQEEARTKEGDIYCLGKHRLICGDSTNSNVIERLLENEKADLLITDPPYNVNYKGGNGLTIQNDNMGDETFRKFLRDAFESADGAMRPGAVFYIWHADSEGYNFRGACHDIGWQVRQCLIWNKSSLVLGRQDYQWKHEPCLYGWKEGAGHLWKSDRKQTTVLEFEKPAKNAEHPTMKPVTLMAYLISNSTNESDLVLDPFGGSGSTMIACEQLNRKCYMVELDPRYCDVIIDRWEKYTGERAVLEER